MNPESLHIKFRDDCPTLRGHFYSSPVQLPTCERTNDRPLDYETGTINGVKLRIPDDFLQYGVVHACSGASARVCQSYVCIRKVLSSRLKSEGVQIELFFQLQASEDLCTLHSVAKPHEMAG